MNYSVLLIPFVLLVACSSAPSESSIQTAVAQTQAAQPTEAPTLTAEQAYVSIIEPAVNDLKIWISGPISEYEVLLTHEAKGWMESEKKSISYWLYIYWRIGPYGGDFESESYKFIVESVAPAAKKVASSGFSVLSSFDSVNPPPSIKTAHDQITSCVQYKVETMAEIERSITTNFFIPNFQESDPCNLLDTALANLEDFSHENR